MRRPVKVGKIIDTVTKRLKIKANCDELEVMWPEIVGTRIAKHTKPIDIVDDLLVIYVDSSAWLHHLFMLKTEVLRTIAKQIPGIAIRDIKMTTRR